MRHALLVLAIVAGPAAAADCDLPFSSDHLYVSADFFDCLEEEIDALRREQARLRRTVEALERDLAATREELKALPGAFVNDDGRISADRNRTLAVASFRVTARQTNGIAALAVDQGVVETLCAETQGCTLTLFLRAEGLRAADPVETVAIGPCLFDYDRDNGAWVRGGACGEAGTLSGTDGNGTPGGADGGEIIAGAGGGCLLTDSDPGLSVGTGTGPLGRDHAKGLYLVAAPALRGGAEGRFRCELKIE